MQIISQQSSQHSHSSSATSSVDTIALEKKFLFLFLLELIAQTLFMLKLFYLRKSLDFSIFRKNIFKKCLGEKLFPLKLFSQNWGFGKKLIPGNYLMKNKTFCSFLQNSLKFVAFPPIFGIKNIYSSNFFDSAQTFI